LLLSVPEMVVKPVVELLMAEDITGKFWRLLSPVSGSSVSLLVTPLVPRSIPRPAFWKIRLERILLPVPPVMATPSSSLPEMTLAAPATVPPISVVGCASKDGHTAYGVAQILGA
jgi:hypothetical protein